MKTGTLENSRDIVARSGSNLAFALAILPLDKRADMEVFYAFCRLIDDLADDPDIPVLERRAGLERWRKLINGGEPNPGVEAEFVELIGKYRLSPAILNEIIDGVAIDFEPVRFRTAEDLKHYCYKVASAVGLISIEIFGYRDDKTRKYAENLGYALQWTNIMRDVGADAGESRIYLPLEDLERFGIRENEVLENRVSQDAFRGLMARQSEAARRFYSEAVELLPEEDKPAMRSPELMRRIYFGILRKMEKDNYRVFEKRYRLSKARMLWEFLRVRCLP